MPVDAEPLNSLGAGFFRCVNTGIVYYDPTGEIMSVA